MKKLQKHDLEQIEILHNIYFEEIPECIKEISECPAMNRIAEIGQNCGRDYLSDVFQTFSYNYSRKTHSIGVALLVWRFTKNIKMTLAGLFHDIAAPTFSHVIDFFNGDAEHQESTEDLTKNIIINSPEIQDVLKKYNLTSEEVWDYADYPIADNKSPRLSADRLEYTCYMGTAMKIITFEELKSIICDIYIEKNEDGVEEMCFKTQTLALKFADVALKCGEYMSSPISNISNQFLADVLKVAVDENVLTEEDFNILSEDELIKKIENSNNEKACKYFNIFKTFSEVYVSDKEDIQNYCINIKVKNRYIDPLCINDGDIARISYLDKNLRKNIDTFLENSYKKYYSMNVKREELK